MSNHIAHIIFIVIMLLSQAAEAFVSPEMPCAQEHMMMLDKAIEGADTDRLMFLQMDDSADSCCQQDCCCPAGLLNIAILIDDPFKTHPDFTHTLVTSYEPAISTVFPTQIQRPPKTL